MFNFNLWHNSEPPNVQDASIKLHVIFHDAKHFYWIIAVGGEDLHLKTHSSGFFFHDGGHIWRKLSLKNTFLSLFFFQIAVDKEKMFEKAYLLTYVKKYSRQTTSSLLCSFLMHSLIDD